ncbi:hypothetical protein CEXT_196981, partial [Caerostris extrusa]
EVHQNYRLYLILITPYQECTKMVNNVLPVMGILESSPLISEEYKNQTTTFI